MNKIEQNLLLLAQKTNPKFSRIEILPQSGSNRQYFRIFAENDTIIGVTTASTVTTFREKWIGFFRVLPSKYV